MTKRYSLELILSNTAATWRHLQTRATPADTMPTMRQLWRGVLQKVAPYDAGKSLEAIAEDLGIESLVRLSANESPLGPSPLAVEALRREAARAHLYPDGGSTDLRNALAIQLGIGPDWL